MRVDTYSGLGLAVAGIEAAAEAVAGRCSVVDSAVAGMGCNYNFGCCCPKAEGGSPKAAVGNCKPFCVYYGASACTRSKLWVYSRWLQLWWWGERRGRAKGCDIPNAKRANRPT
jgi:hypothetical protein